MDMQPISGGFADAPRQSALAFRAIIDVMSRPGKLATLQGATPPASLSVAAGTVILTLADANTGIYLAGDLDSPALRQWIAFHTGAPITTADCADLAIGTWADLHPLDRYRTGTVEYPDRAATLIVELGETPAPNASLTGPGIKDRIAAFVPGARPTSFPLGLDLILTAGAQVSALPRSTQVEFA
ncbi:phosphonate C-P lyase system protein PhnH [Paracoccus litorisediminis]|jgi:alpha-D-ribose 1-methylphosphonate 5-triphosphate synthase subunit PhnH|uniref:Phosphonate C-P lyase system protein PhnH n=1 Tax=Paracoccus litorisediminis TaxID=2006130 RepID=A0A844HQW1_9RHOB|nr:phosphonate C-P lyase system protein PhnH [Paracoccus litorisediminis]MTH62236.1 phosphonate C-P lyase system protein PhnH [Paracoccus litorisediminis]